ncbi:MAG: hypothetical protein NXY57DRAFT_1044693, partial [Lentinula lateritia]
MEPTLDIALHVELCNFPQTKECITSRTRRPKQKLVALDLEPPTPIHAFDEEVEVEDHTRQIPSPKNPDDRANLNPMFTTFKIHTFPSSAPISRARRQFPYYSTYLGSSHYHLGDACDHCKVLRLRCTRPDECITSRTRRPKQKLVALDLEPPTPIHAFDEEVEVEDHTRQIPSPKNPDDRANLNPMFTTFKIHTFPSSAPISRARRQFPYYSTYLGSSHYHLGDACDHCKVLRLRCSRPDGGLTACE